MSGPAPKPASRRQNRITRGIGSVSSTVRVPEIPAGLCTGAEAAWSTYWDDALSGAVRDPDATIVVRWVKNLDRYHRLMSEADREPMVVGSTGQPKTNPIYDLALKIEASIKADEQQLGMGPLNRLRLGVALSESAKSLGELNAEAEGDAEDDDPRAGLAVINA